MSDSLLFETTYPEEIYVVKSPTTIVMATPWKALSENEVELLSKILSSVKLSLAAVRIVEAKKLDLSSWPEKPSKLIGFGIEMTGVKTYEVITTPQTQLLLADSLSILANSEDLKKKLWKGLKQLFFG